MATDSSAGVGQNTGVQRGQVPDAPAGRGGPAASWEHGGLTASCEEYRSIVECAVFGIFRARADGQFLTANGAFVAMLRYDSAAQLRDVGLASLFVDRAIGLEFLSQHSGAFAGTEVVWKRRDGEYIRVRLSGRLTDDRELQRPVFEVIAEDVTDQHQLRQTQKMEAVGQLAGGIAHHFNNVLTAILGYSELLADQFDPDKAVGRDLREIRTAAERAASLTQQLLAFSRKQVIAMTPTDLAVFVRTLEPKLRRLLPESIRLERRHAADLDLMLADATQLEHLLISLSENAREAMPHGGTLTIGTDNRRLGREFVIAHPGSAEGDFAALSVTDTGIGMPPDVQRRVFEPFFTTKERYRGAGLGLAAVYGMVKQMGGYIGAESEVGKGATFTIYLPRAARATLPEKARVADLRSAGTETVLLVEDEGAVREFTKIALQRSGYRVIEAESAEVALELLESMERLIHLLLTDVVLPGIDGRELARRVCERRPEARVLFMSGYTRALCTEDGYRMPGVQLIEKPFTAQALLARTRQLLAPASAIDRPA